jgi:hypothetical protein
MHHKSVQNGGYEAEQAGGNRGGHSRGRHHGGSGNDGERKLCGPTPQILWRLARNRHGPTAAEPICEVGSPVCRVLVCWGMRFLQ